MEHIFTHQHWPRINSRLRFRILLFLVIALVLFALMAYDTFIGEAAWWMVLLGLVVGLVVGYAYGRFSRVRWHEERSEVVRQNDVLGFILIGGYVLLSIGRDYLLRDLLTGAALLAVSFAVASGILLGRFFGFQIPILRVLRENPPV